MLLSSNVIHICVRVVMLVRMIRTRLPAMLQEKPTLIGRIAPWQVLLSEFDIVYAT